MYYTGLKISNQNNVAQQQLLAREFPIFQFKAGEEHRRVLLAVSGVSISTALDWPIAESVLLVIFRLIAQTRGPFEKRTLLLHCMQLLKLLIQASVQVFAEPKAATHSLNPPLVS